MNNKTFISFEGCEGSGKTTIISLLKEKLIKDKIFQSDNIVITREPGGVKISEDIRNIILDNNNNNMDARTEAILYAASRRQHLVEKVLPALSKNKIILCDRFLDSSLVYQGIARGIGINEVFELNKFAIDEMMPSLTIYLDIEAKIGLNRIENRNLNKNRLDNESLEFHNKVRNGYLELFKKWPKRIKKIDASNSIDKVLEQVFRVVLRHLKDE